MFYLYESICCFVVVFVLFFRENAAEHALKYMFCLIIITLKNNFCYNLSYNSMTETDR